MKGYDARTRLNRLVMVYMSIGVIRYKASQNESHPSYDHDLKHDISLVNLHRLGLGIDFYLDMSIMLALLGSTF